MTVIYRGHIRSAEDVHFVPGQSAAEAIVAKHWGGVYPATLDTTARAQATVNHGRWIVQCPWCPAATLASKLDRRFFCPECGSGPVSGRWVAVNWPADAHAIEAVLARRPEQMTRNWAPPETVMDLEAENSAHGVL